MIEVKQRVDNMHQIFKEPKQVELKQVWRIALVCSLPKSFHHAKSAKLSLQKLIHDMSPKVINSEKLCMSTQSTSSLIKRPVTRKKQNP